MEILKVTIPGMKTNHCQMTVTAAVKSIGGVMRSVASTKAEIELTNGLTSEVVIHAIENAGYKALADKF